MTKAIASCFPAARVHGYDENWNLKPAELAARYRLFTLQLPLDAEPCAGCRVIGQRLEIRGRHSSEELQAMLKGDVFQHLFVKELLVESSQVDAKMLMLTVSIFCRKGQILRIY